MADGLFQLYVVESLVHQDTVADPFFQAPLLFSPASPPSGASSGHTSSTSCFLPLLPQRPQFASTKMLPKPSAKPLPKPSSSSSSEPPLPPLLHPIRPVKPNQHWSTPWTRSCTTSPRQPINSRPLPLSIYIFTSS